MAFNQNQASGEFSSQQEEDINLQQQQPLESGGESGAANQSIQQQTQEFASESEQILQVIYERQTDGSYHGVGANLVQSDGNDQVGERFEEISPAHIDRDVASLSLQQTTSRAGSTLPSVLEESSSGDQGLQGDWAQASNQATEETYPNLDESELKSGGDSAAASDQPQHYYVDLGSNIPGAIYSVVNKPVAIANLAASLHQNQSDADHTEHQQGSPFCGPGETATSFYSDAYNGDEAQAEKTLSFVELAGDQIDSPKDEPADENIENLDEEIGRILSRLRQGAVESGSFKNNFRRKQQQQHQSDSSSFKNRNSIDDVELEDQLDDLGGEPMKRAHSTRSSRLSVDIRNLPSYLTSKRASIVDVAKGAMSSLMQSFNSGAASSASSQRRDSSSSDEDEPIFEEPIAPTLSLGQRVALVQPEGTEFGTVGWIGQLPEVDDDWIVGVIFDNMIGNCDGSHQGIRYFYARENYAMFVPLSALTKTDNYIGRPETGTMLSRMSVQLKPGQLISIQRSSIRLQHCFLNAPHQRVGHDVRAVSNRLHCQCHNCGPCAHLTKQSRVGALPHFGAIHTHHGKKNSLVQAAIELLSHHHHHLHEEQEHDKENEDHQFGDNAAHACNYVRYSCCQQTGVAGHDFLSDCEMVRPELLDNLIHAPRAPHRRSRPKRRRTRAHKKQSGRTSTGSNNRASPGDFKSPTSEAIEQEKHHKAECINNEVSDHNEVDEGGEEDYDNQSDSCRSSSSSSSRSSSGLGRPSGTNINPPLNYPTDQRPENDVYNTIDTQISFMDQRRFVSQRDSTAFIQSSVSYPSENSLDRPGRFGISIRRCFNCLFGRGRRYRSRLHRKQSARNKLIEFRRKQSTFIPSTLAKPQDDFASHNMPMSPYGSFNPLADHSNSDYSSGSGSSGGSPFQDFYGEGVAAKLGAQQQQHYWTRTEENFDGEIKNSGLLNRDLFHSEPFDDLDSCKKSTWNSQTNWTEDQGFYDAYASTSNDTLKNIVDHSINEQVRAPTSNSAPRNLEAGGSPLVSSPGCNSSCCAELPDVSSPTISIVAEADDHVGEMLDRLNLDEQSFEDTQ